MPEAKPILHSVNESASHRAYRFAKVLGQNRSFTKALWAGYGQHTDAATAMDALARDIMAVVDALP